MSRLMYNRYMPRGQPRPPDETQGSGEHRGQPDTPYHKNYTQRTAAEQDGKEIFSGWEGGGRRGLPLLGSLHSGDTAGRLGRLMGDLFPGQLDTGDILLLLILLFLGSEGDETDLLLTLGLMLVLGMGSEQKNRHPQGEEPYGCREEPS